MTLARHLQRSFGIELNRRVGRVALCVIAGGFSPFAQGAPAQSSREASESNLVTCAFVEEADPVTADEPTFEHFWDGWFTAEDFLDCRVLAADVESVRTDRDVFRITLEPRDALRFHEWIERSANRRVGVFVGGQLAAVLPVSSCSGDALLIWATEASSAVAAIASTNGVEFERAYAPGTGTESWIELQRTEAPDGCAAYRLRLHADGSLEYAGVAGVAQVGERRAMLPAVVTRRLFLRFQAADFFSLPELASAHEPHATLLTLQVNGRTQRVIGSDRADATVGSSSAGRELVDLLARVFETEARAQRWTGREELAKCEQEPLSAEYSPKDASSLEIRLVRGECYGRCPIYEVVIRGDGTVDYVGAKHVAVTGVATTAISPAFIRRLIGQFQGIDFWKLRDRYDTHSSDIPAIAISLRMNGQAKKVVNRWSGFRDELLQLPELQTHLALDAVARAIDMAVDSEQWVRPSAPKSPR